MPPVPFVLIADDFAITDGVSEAILALLAAERLSGTGVMTNQPGWRDLATGLRPHWDRRDIGLHLTLTLGAPLGAMPIMAPSGRLPDLKVLLRASLTGQLPGVELQAEIIRQIEAFSKATGRLPDFIDGHQHVHVLPGVRGALFDAIEAIQPGWRPWLRDPADGLGAILARGVSVGKSLVIAALAQGFGRTALLRGFATNEGFSGASGFDPEGSYEQDFQRYLMVPGRRHLIMCHPGRSDAALVALDPATGSRDKEYGFFSSHQFLDLLAAMTMRVARFGECG
jgi:chitin disaccharide deacetylase